MKMERAGDRVWLSIRNGFPIDSGMFSVSLTGHQRQQSAVMSALRGGKAYNDFPICRSFHMVVFQSTAFIGTIPRLDAWL